MLGVYSLNKLPEREVKVRKSKDISVVARKLTKPELDKINEFLKRVSNNDFS